MATAPRSRSLDRQRRAVVGPREGNGGFLWTFDPSVVTDHDGSQWIFYGSYNGGVFVAPLDASGSKVTGAARMVAIDNKFEGAYVVRHRGYWYLFASTANCCAGSTTATRCRSAGPATCAGPMSTGRARRCWPRTPEAPRSST